MRYHFKPFVFIVTLSFLSTIGFAAPNFQAPPATSNFPTTPTPTAPTSTAPAMTASDFAAKVERLQQETQNRLAKQVDAALPKPAAPSTRPITTTATSDQPITPTTTTSAPPTQTYTGFGTAPAPKTPVKPATPSVGGGLKIQY